MAFCRIFLMLCILVMGVPGWVAAQEIPSNDPFEDDNARELVMSFLRAVEARDIDRDSYQALLTTRQHVGFLIPNQWAWRARTLFHKETAALMDFYPTDPQPTTLVGKTRGAPMIGDRIIDNPAWFGRFGFDPERESPALFGLLSFLWRRSPAIFRSRPITSYPASTRRG